MTNTFTFIGLVALQHVGSGLGLELGLGLGIKPVSPALARGFRPILLSASHSPVFLLPPSTASYFKILGEIKFYF